MLLRWKLQHNAALCLVPPQKNYVYVNLDALARSTLFDAYKYVHMQVVG